MRILHNLDRFSEDLNFTLLKTDPSFDLSPYNQAIADELRSFGFEVTVESKNKTIESAFIKATTKQQLIIIGAESVMINRLHHQLKH